MSHIDVKGARYFRYFHTWNITFDYSDWMEIEVNLYIFTSEDFTSVLNGAFVYNMNGRFEESEYCKSKFVIIGHFVNICFLILIECFVNIYFDMG